MEYKIMNVNEFSVIQFFKSGDREKVRDHVSGEEAVKAFYHYTNNVATRVGIIARVILTDGGDCINMEWVHGKGITFPLGDATKTDSSLEDDLTKIVVQFHKQEDGE